MSVFGSRFVSMTMGALLLIIGAVGVVPANANPISNSAIGSALVQLKAGADAAELFDDQGITAFEEIGIAGGLYEVTLDPFRPHTAQLETLNSIEGVEFAEPNYLIETNATPDDPRVVNQETWGLYSTSPSSSYGANAAGAWSKGYTGGRAVYVAVIDSGIDVTHPDLAANIWTNAAETPGNGIDDDGNGFIDDVNGYDFLNNDGSVYDEGEHPHGTHVAGTIGAVGGNATGVAGVAWQVSLISAKISNSRGESNTANAIRAIDYVTMLRTKKGIDIIASNNSWGGTGYSKALEDAIKRGGDVGIVFVAAAGNDGGEIGTIRQYPAAYDCTTPHRPFDCVVSVAALNQDGALAGYSNYSATFVDLAAPGTNVLSTMPGANYGYMSGTSMAAPHVTGAIALCVSSYRGTTAKQAIEKIKSTAVANAALTGKVVTGGHLNIAATVDSCVAETAGFSGALTNHFASALYTDRVRLDWDDTAVGDYEQEVQFSVGPRGCAGTFAHLGFLGPGLTALPVFNLEEAQFYCFRSRGIKDSQVGSWALSNVTITWTSNLPFLTGRVFLSDGVTPVAGAPVRWLAEGAAPGNDDSNALLTYTNLSGEYVLQVSNGTPGELFVGMTRRATGRMTQPPIAWGLRAAGKLTITQDTTLDLRLPAQRTVNFTLTDQDTGAPIAGATILNLDLADYCRAAPFSLFAGATNSSCGSWPTGYSSSAARTDANGKVSLVFLDGQYTNNALYSLSFKHPTNPARVLSVQVDPNRDRDLFLVMEGLIELSGKVVLNDGVTPVSNATVKWLSAGSPKSGENTNAISTQTDSQGNYSIRVTSGVAGEISLHTPRNAASGSRSNPLLPWGLWAWSAVAGPTQSKTVNLTANPFHNLTLKVVNNDGSPIAGATVQSADLGAYCRSGTHAVVAGASSSGCQNWPTGYPSNAPKTNSQGELVLPLLPNASVTIASYRLSIAHPTNASMVSSVNVAISGNAERTITLSNLVTVSGKVVLSDGVTPVQNISVKWLPTGQNGGTGQDTWPGVKTNSLGEYSLQAVPGTSGELYASTTRTPSAAEQTTPLTPWGLYAGGKITISQEIRIDLTLPKQENLRYTVTEFASQEPVVGAKLTYARNAEHCNRGGYLPFPGAVGATCQFWPVGYSSRGLVTNASGFIDIPVLERDYFTNLANYTIAVTHPLDPKRVLTAVDTGGVTRTLVMPGTPSKPEQPSATALTNEVSLRWTEPWNGGAFIDYYKVWVSLDAAGPFTLVETGSCAGLISPEKRNCVVTALTPGVVYYFAIIAHNVVGYSQLSSVISAAPVAAVSVFSQSSSPVVRGQLLVGEFLSAEPGSWDSGAVFDYEWLANGSVISGSVGSSYKLRPEDAGRQIQSRITARKSGHTSVTRLSTEVTPAWPTSGKLVQIAGLPSVGGVLSAQITPLLAASVVSYQWFRSGEAIEGATDNFYEPKAEDSGQTLSVRLSGVTLETAPIEVRRADVEIAVVASAAVSITASALIGSTTVSPPVARDTSQSPVAIPVVPVTTQVPAITSAQRSLAAFTSLTLNSMQQDAVKRLLTSAPSASKFVCTAIRFAGASATVNLVLRRQAKAICDFAKGQKPTLSIWVQSKPTTARSFAGRVLMVAKG